MHKGIFVILAVFFLSALAITSCKKDSSDPTTCSNGVMDGDETGIDCGGSCTACSTTPSCSNGIKDGNETGIDCGGSCAACTTTVNKTYYFKGDVGGNEVINQDNTVTPTASRNSANNICYYSLGCFITADDIFGTVENGFSLDFLNIYTGQCPAINDTSIYNHLLDVGTYTFDAGPSGSVIKVSLLIDGTHYDTQNYGTQPSTSTFSIVESTPIAPFNGDDAVKVKATFRCMLKSDAGDVIEITNGETVSAIYDYD
ncbi:hypothetical protein BH09BAC1_BH09BAC1_20550 [soil metagenome]